MAVVATLGAEQKVSVWVGPQTPDAFGADSGVRESIRDFVIA